MRRHIKEYDTHIKIFFCGHKGQYRNTNDLIPRQLLPESSKLQPSNFFKFLPNYWTTMKTHQNKKFKNYPVCWSIQTIKYSRTYKTYYSIKLIQHFIMRLQTQKYVIKSKRSPKNSASISPLLKSLIENPADQHIFFWQRNWINSISS